MEIFFVIKDTFLHIQSQPASNSTTYNFNFNCIYNKSSHRILIMHEMFLTHLDLELKLKHRKENQLCTLSMSEVCILS